MKDSTLLGSNWSIYGLTDPRTGKIRYCGMTSEKLTRRLQMHLAPCNLRKRTHKNCWIKSLLRDGVRPAIVLLVTGLTMKQAAAAEIAYIAAHREELTNEAIGGAAPMAGRKHTEATKQLMSEKRQGEKNGFFGKTHTEETRERISKGLKGKTGWANGIPKPDKQRQKISDGLRGNVPWNKGKSRLDHDLIRRLKSEGMTQPAIASLLGTTQSNVSRIINNVTRVHKKKRR